MEVYAARSISCASKRHIFSVSGDVVFDEDLGPEAREMVESVERKKKSNGQRLIDILQRVHRLDEICKKVSRFRSRPHSFLFCRKAGWNPQKRCSR